MTESLSPVQIEIYWKRLTTAVDEAAATLVRVSFSSVIRDFHDYACALFDADGRLLAQSTRSTPGLLGVLPYTIQSILKHPRSENAQPGDVFITNDPWLASGHLIDITIASPVFYKGKLVAWMMCIVHHLNVGGRVGTLMSRDVFEEGIKIPILKLYDRGKPDDAVFSILRDNVREPDKVLGDLRAQISANEAAGAKLIELLQFSGLNDLQSLADEIISRSEATMRDALRALPRGEASSTMILRGIAGYDEPVTLSVKLTIGDGEIEVDYSGTSGQIPRAVNVVLNMTRSYTVYPLKCMLAPDIPNNSGFMTPIKIKAPEGCILNAKFPAANWGRTLTAHMLPELIMSALAKVLPEKIISASGATPLWYGNIEGRYKDGQSYYAVVVLNGGMGARYSKDGVPCVTFPANVANIPIEVIESDAPILFECKEFSASTAGAGRQRGGAGQHTIMTIPKHVAERLDGPVTAGIRGNRFNVPISGVFGGQAGGNPVSTLNGSPVTLGTIIDMHSGDQLELVIPGGAGFGDPKERNAESIWADIQNELISLQDAKRLYGFTPEKTKQEKVVEFVDGA